MDSTLWKCEYPSFKSWLRHWVGARVEELEHGEAMRERKENEAWKERGEGGMRMWHD
jgi:hypothetical protein